VHCTGNNSGPVPSRPKSCSNGVPQVPSDPAVMIFSLLYLPIFFLSVCTCHFRPVYTHLRAHISHHLTRAFHSICLLILYIVALQGGSDGAEQDRRHQGRPLDHQCGRPVRRPAPRRRGGALYRE
jgi:hypothetical protein